MSKNQPKSNAPAPISWETLRELLRHEADLHDQRTIHFLTASSVLGGVAALAPFPYLQLLLALVGVTICVLWILVGWRTRQAVGWLRKIVPTPKDSEDKALYDFERGFIDFINKRAPLRATVATGIYLPIVFLVAWCLGILFSYFHSRALYGF